jgi:hypothetical protein
MKAKTWRNDRSPEVREHRGSGPGQTQWPPFPQGNAGPVVLLAPQGSVEALLLRRVVPGGGGTGLRGALSVPARVRGIHPQSQPEQGLLAVPAAEGLTIDRGQGGGRRSPALTRPPKGRNKKDQARSRPAGRAADSPGHATGRTLHGDCSERPAIIPAATSRRAFPNPLTLPARGRKIGPVRLPHTVPSALCPTAGLERSRWAGAPQAEPAREPRC